MGRKATSSIGSLLDYILRDEALLKDGKGNARILRHNVIGRTIPEMEKALEENEANRRYHNKRSNKFYHDILSFSLRDTPHLDMDKLEDLAREYVRLRNENSMAVGSFHGDRDHLHAHLLLSGVEIGSGETIRVTREEFKRIKIELQEYQQRKYPELVSVVEHSKKRERDVPEKEFQLVERTGKPSRKEDIRAILHASYEKAISPDAFYKELEQQGLTLYKRGHQMGIEDNRNYRLSTLGYGPEKLEELEKSSDRMEELASLRGDKESRAMSIDGRQEAGVPEGQVSYEATSEEIALESSQQLGNEL